MQGPLQGKVSKQMAIILKLGTTLTHLQEFKTSPVVNLGKYTDLMMRDRIYIALLALFNLRKNNRIQTAVGIAADTFFEQEQSPC